MEGVGGMGDLERSNAELATEIIKKAGGEVTFDEYDKLMSGQKYFVPMRWGWHGTVGRRPDADKLCVFTACRLELVEKTDAGYKVITQ